MWGFAGLDPHNRTGRPDKRVEVVCNSVVDAGSIPASSTNFNQVMNADTWHIPIRQDDLIIRDALKTMESFKLNQDDVPFIIRLFENPKYKLLPGAVTLKHHDIIHVLLGRGLLPKDEAFVIGFTMGTTKKLTNFQKNIFKFVSRFLYPEGYSFGVEELDVFEAGLNSADKMDCPDFSTVDFTKYLDYTILDARKELEIDYAELIKDYAIERMWYQDSVESQRLL